MEPTSDIDSLIQSVLTARGTDTVIHVEKRRASNQQITAVLDAFVTRLGFEGLGDQWREITREGATRLLSHVLERDLAYNAQLVKPPLAADLAMRFLKQFDVDSRYFANGTFHTDSPEWTPITDYTFDTGVIVADSANIGILWVRDED